MSRVKSSCTVDARTMPSMCDENSLMSIPAILDMIQDVAGIHADEIGIGALRLEEAGLFWIVSKIRLKIIKRLKVTELFKMTTWIQPPDKVSCERDFRIEKNGESVAYARSIWAALRRDNGRLAHMADFYPDPDQDIAPPDDEPFTRIRKDFEDGETIGEYRIRSVDIDRGGHMNNVNYVRAMLGCFTCGQLKEMDISEIDMQFLNQCYEGGTIRFVKRASDSAIMEIGAFNEEGTLCFAAAIK